MTGSAQADQNPKTATGRYADLDAVLSASGQALNREQGVPQGVPQGARSRRLVNGAIAVLTVFCFALLVGCERTESVQWGERGTSMTHIDKPSRILTAVDDHGIPPPEPRDPPDPDIPLAKDVNENVQVLTDLDALEFARLMQAISTWVSPEEGCEYCHNTDNLASDEKYTKVVSRRMLQMTRDINTNWKSHVVGTGVTCWTCHRGQPVPSEIWFTDPGPKTPSAGITGVKAGQNTAGVRANANSSLPFDPLTPFLEGDKPVSIQGTAALASGTGQSVKQAEWTYALMMYISNSLGVNCTYCHQTRAMGVWEQSTPQRTTAWYGIRMVRELNAAFLNPLKTVFPEDRLGPTGDAPKIGCATCHKGAFKPLLGVSMLGDYPELAGVKPPRALPAAEAEPAVDASSIAAIPAVGAMSIEVEDAAAGAELVEPTVVAQAAVDATAAAALGVDVAVHGEPLRDASETGVDPFNALQHFLRIATLPDASETGVEPPVEASVEPVAEPTPGLASALIPEQAEPVVAADLVNPAPDWTDKLVEVDAAITDLRDGLTVAATERQALREEIALVAAAVATPAVGEALQSGSEPAAASDPVEPQSLSVLDVDVMSPDVQHLQSEADQTGEDIQQIEADAEALRERLSEGSTEPMSGVDAAALKSLEGRISATEAKLAQERAALLQQLKVVRAQRDAAEAASELRAAQVAEDLGDRHQAALAAAQQRVRAAGARLEQERLALQQQLEVVRSQRDTASNAVTLQVAQVAEDLGHQHEAALAAAQQRVRAAGARLDQERLALQQQLEVVRSQRDAANDASTLQAAQLAEELGARHESALAMAQQRVTAAGARLEQERTALQQQLGVVRAQRDAAQTNAEKAFVARSAEREEALQAVERRVAAAEARLSQERHALQQQLRVVRAQRDGATSEIDTAVANLAAQQQTALSAVERRVTASEARLHQERHALQQQLRVVRDQRDGAASEIDTAVAALAAQKQEELNAVARRVAAAEARLNQERHALQQQLRVVRAQRDSAATEGQAAVADLSLELSAVSARLAESDRELEGVRTQLQAASADHSRELQASRAAVERVKTLQEVVAEVGGRVTDNGILVSLGGDELRFPTGSATLPRRELPTLERVVALLTERPQIKAQIGGHTDSSGSAEINQALSQQRAEAVKRALVERGIDEGRLSTAGYGADQPIADNATEAGRRENRRVDILMIDGDAGAGSGITLD